LIFHNTYSFNSTIICQPQDNETDVVQEYYNLSFGRLQWIPSKMNCEADSIEALHRGGQARSSVEAVIMAAERRD
jgi:hypothetical protein